jgi:phosphoglycolate phosphatase
MCQDHNIALLASNPSTMIKCVIFDFDGTIADSKAVFISVYNQIAEKYNYKHLESDQLQHLRMLTFNERCRYLRVPLYRIPFLAGEFLAHYKNELRHIKLFDGMRGLLEDLHASGFETAIISSNEKSNISGFLAENGIHSIDKIYCSTSLFGKHKLIKGFLKTYKLLPDNVLYVGDEVRDIVACKKAGVKIAWVDWGYDLKEAVADEKPDYLISNPMEIISIVTKYCTQRNG